MYNLVRCMRMIGRRLFLKIEVQMLNNGSAIIGFFFVRMLFNSKTD